MTGIKELRCMVILALDIVFHLSRAVLPFITVFSSACIKHLQVWHLISENKTALTLDVRRGASA